MGKLEGKVAVVTGGTGGIGLATAQAFVREGAFVFIIGRRQAELDEAVALIGPNCKGVQGDVAQQGDLDRLYEVVRTEKGYVDIVFANAGIARLARLGSLTDSHIDDLFDINVKGVIHTVQKALPRLRPGASIILNASIVGSKGFANWSVYSATKAAVRSFARTWASDLKGRDIRVNAISPGVIETPGYGTVGMSAADLKGYFDFTKTMTPLERNGTAEDVASVVTFLASDESRFMTGSEVFVDGGFAQI